MDNLARNEIELTTNDQEIKRGERWYLIDLEEFEFQVREDERRKFYARKKAARDRKRNEEKNKRKLFLKSLPFRFGGLLLLLTSLKLCEIGTFFNEKIGINDYTILLITIPVSLILMFAPSRFDN